ncbi:MAG: HPF/RaiA family ribosome-associated protein [Nanoarchaeota archaeon]
MMINIIKYIGLKDLSELEQSSVKKTLEREYEKIHRLIKNITNITCHIKLYDIEGKAKKYSVHIRAEAPTKIFTANTADWDLGTALHECINGVKKEIESHLTKTKRGKLELKKFIRKAERIKR